MTLVIAEAGLNHNGDPNLAHAMIDAAADAGADAIKFQCYRTSDFVRDRTLTYQGESQAAMFERYELDDEDWPGLRYHCDQRNIVFFATPTSEERLDFLIHLGVAMLKNGSDYLTNLPLIRSMARTGLPTILSTGMAHEDEVEAAIAAYDVAGGEHLTLMHCTSTYPTKPADVNLRRMATIGEFFDVPVGFSDHTVGVTAALGAVALGATMIEKHFTLDHGLDGPDHRFSADPIELRALVAAVTMMEGMLGEPEIKPTKSEKQARRDFRVTLGDDGLYLRR